MKEKMLEQLNKELKLGTAADLVTVIGAVIVTLILFAIAAVAAQASGGMPSLDLGGGMFGGGGLISHNELQVTPTIILFVTLIVIAVINWYAIRMLVKNKAQRAKVNEGLAKLLKDETLDQYHDGAIFKTYETRYSLYAVITGSVAAMSIIVPLVIFIDRMTKL